MFGTIGRARPKPGTEAQFQELADDWWQTIRPKIPGTFVEMLGRPKDRPGEVIFIALAQDEATYRQLAEMPEQDDWYRRMSEHFDGDPTWEDIEIDVVRKD
jgi:hypothetical protein